MDKIKAMIATLEGEIAGLFDNNKCGHDMGHLWRTLDFALKLQDAEGGDREVIAVSAFIHDIHRIMEKETGKFVAPRESLPVIRKLIAPLPLTDAQKEHICHAIEHHEKLNFGRDRVTINDIESLVLQDADNLDGIGPHAVDRCVRYGKQYGRPVYDPSVPFYQKDDWAQGDFNDASSVHHMHNIVRAIDVLQ